MICIGESGECKISQKTVLNEEQPVMHRVYCVKKTKMPILSIILVTAFIKHLMMEQKVLYKITYHIILVKTAAYWKMKISKLTCQTSNH